MIPTPSVTEMKIRSKQYKQYILDKIEEFNTNGKKTLLITCDAFFPVVDGVVRVIENYATLLQDKMNVMLLTPCYKGKIGVYSYPVIGVKSGFSKRLNNQVPLPMFDVNYRRYLKKLRIDVIHCHSPFTVGRVAMRLSKQRKIPLVCTFHSQYKRDFQQQAKVFTNFMMRYIMKCFNSSTETWTMHAASRDTLLSYGYKGKVKLMPNGTSMLPANNYAEERNTGRAKYMTDTNVPLLIFVGRLTIQKNILFIVDVLAELKRRKQPFKMLYVGDGPEKDHLERKIEAEGLADQIQLVGKKTKEELQEIFSAADLFLFPSLYDVSSLVQVEAASRYTPAAFVEGSVTSCTVTDGVNGFILPHDVQLYADGVCKVLQNPKLLAEVSQNAYKDLYVTWEDLMKDVYARYMQLIEESKAK